MVSGEDKKEEEWHGIWVEWFSNIMRQFVQWWVRELVWPGWGLGMSIRWGSSCRLAQKVHQISYIVVAADQVCVWVMPVATTVLIRLSSWLISFQWEVRQAASRAALGRYCSCGWEMWNPRDEKGERNSNFISTSFVRIQAFFEVSCLLRWTGETCRDQEPSVPDYPKFRECLGALKDHPVFREVLGALKDPFECPLKPVWGRTYIMCCVVIFSNTNSITMLYMCTQTCLCIVP